MGLDFHIALSGLRAGEAMLQVAQNNIANAKNPHYARQRVDVSALGIPLGDSGHRLQMGSGVWINEVVRIKDDLLIQQVRIEEGKVGYNKGLQEVLSNVEIIFGELNENSISTLTTNFFNSLQEANKYPEQSSYRLDLVYNSVLLSDKLQGISSQLDEIKSQTDSKIQSEINKVNDLLDGISSINKKMESMGSDQINALLDERDGLLDELSSYIDIETTQSEGSNKLEIRVGNTKLLNGKEYYPVQGDIISPNNNWLLTAGDIRLDLKSGSIKGLIESRNELVDKYESKLNTFTSYLINEVNDIHKNGFGLDGTTGEVFFEGTDIRSIKVNQLFRDNPEKIGLSSINGISGNNDIGKQLEALIDKKMIDGKTLGGYYQELTIEMGSDLNVARENYIIHQSVASSLETERQKVQGVSIDEELTDMMMFQQYYQANSKTIKVVQTLMNELMTII